MLESCAAFAAWTHGAEFRAGQRGHLAVGDGDETSAAGDGRLLQVGAVVPQAQAQRQRTAACQTSTTSRYRSRAL